MPPLKPLHADHTLIPSKLEQLRKLTTQQLLDSLAPGRQDALRARPDGTIINVNHRVKILRERGIDVDLLPREVIAKSELQN